MITKSILTSTLYFDLETAGNYKNLKELEKNNPRLADLWKKRCEWLRKNSSSNDLEKTDAELYLDKASLHPEFGRVVCATFGVFSNDGSSKKIASFIGEEVEILNNCNKFLEKSKR